jgi:antitoxin component YwqK of YwqJK toxin-antitoxin module
MDLKILSRAVVLVFLMTLPLMACAPNNKKLSDMAQELYHSKRIPCTDNTRCVCLSHTTSTQAPIFLPLRYTKSQLCAIKIEADHIIEIEFISWDESGNKVDEGHLLNGKSNGLWVSWHPNGAKAQEGNYRDGKPVGIFTSWHDNGQIAVQSHHNDRGNLDGECLYWDKTGKLTKKLIWNNGKLISKQEIK